MNKSLDPPVLDNGNHNSHADHASIEILSKSTPVEGLDIPIAIRKGKRTGTSHHFSDYMCYNSLSPFYRAFTNNLTSIATPKSVQEALSILEW